MGTSLAFSAESLALFLKKFPEYSQDEVFKHGDVSKIVTFYIDDGLLFSQKSLGWESHLKIVKFVLFVFEISGLKIKLEKCQFLCTQTNFLGLYLNTDTNIHYIPEKKIDSFKAWPKPVSQGELNSRLSCLNFYSKYIPYFKQIVFPLLDLAKNEKFIWLDVHERSWTELKFLLSFTMKLHFVKPSDKLCIFTDSHHFLQGFAWLK